MIGTQAKEIRFINSRPGICPTSAFYNDIVSGDGKVYFDDVVTEEEKWSE